MSAGYDMALRRANQIRTRKGWRMAARMAGRLVYRRDTMDIAMIRSALDECYLRLHAVAHQLYALAYAPEVS